MKSGQKSRYTEEQIYTAIEVSHLEGGSPTQASKLTGIPVNTIQHWRDKEKKGELEDFINEKVNSGMNNTGGETSNTDHNPEALSQLRAEWRGKYVEQAGNLVISIIQRMAELVPESKSVKDLAVGLGILTEKIALLSGNPTSRHETVSQGTDREAMIKTAREAVQTAAGQVTEGSGGDKSKQLQ